MRTNTLLVALATSLSFTACENSGARAGGCYPYYYAPVRTVYQRPVIQFREDQYYQLLAQLRSPIYVQSAGYAQPGAVLQPGQSAQPAQPVEPSARDVFNIMRENADLLGLSVVPRLNPPPSSPSVPTPTGGTQPGAPPAGGNPQQPPQQPGQPPQQPGQPGLDGEAAQLDQRMRQLVTAKCVQCHDSKGGVMGQPIKFRLDPSIVVDFTQPDTLPQLACVVMAEIVSGHMPRDAAGNPQPLGQDDAALAVKWERALRISSSRQQLSPQQAASPPTPMGGR